MNSLQDYKYLVAVSETLHFGKAAERCHISQPTLSGQLKKMEMLLGFEIFERSNRQVRVTRKGQQMVDAAKKIIAAQKSFKQKAREVSSPFTGEIHLGLIPTLAPYLLPLIMPRLNKELEQLNFYLYEQQTEVLMAELVEGKLDALILPWLPEMHSVDKTVLFDEPLILAVPTAHELADKDDLSLSDLEGQQVLTLKDGHCLRDQTLGYCFARGASEDTSFSATSLETLRHMIATGAGISLLPELAVRNRADKGIVYRKFHKDIPHRTIVLLTRKSYGLSLMTEEITHIIQSIMRNQ